MTLYCQLEETVFPWLFLKQIAPVTVPASDMEQKLNHNLWYKSLTLIFSVIWCTYICLISDFNTIIEIWPDSWQLTAPVDRANCINRWIHSQNRCGSFGTTAFNSENPAVYHSYSSKGLYIYCGESKMIGSSTIKSLWTALRQYITRCSHTKKEIRLLVVFS